MGYMKHYMEELEAKNQIALQIAIEAGVLERCEYHEEAILYSSADIEGAYRLGNAKWSKGELRDVFQDRRDMTDNIKNAVQGHGAIECYSCRKWMDD